MESMPIQKLYPERSSENIGPKIEKLRQLERGASPDNELSQSEEEEVLAFENSLGEQLEPIYAITPKISVISLNYLKTPTGREDFEKVFNLLLPEGDITNDELRTYLYQNELAIGQIDSKTRAQFEGRAQASTEKEMVADLTKTLTDDFHIDVSVITDTPSSRMLLSPEKSLEKITRLRALKQELKDQYNSLEDDVSEGTEVKKGLIDLYLRRVNEMLSVISQTGRSLRKKTALGIELSEAESTLYSHIYDSKDFDRVIARYDKFQHGASTEADEFGMYPQIGSTIIELTKQYANEYNQSILSAQEMMLQKGLDSTLVEDENGYQPTEIQAFAEEVLSSYGLLSNDSPETYDPTRNETATDGKWQVIVSDQFNSMGVNGRQKVVKIPNKPISAKQLFTVGLAHEIEGHVLQHNNKPKLGLRLFQKIGSDRSGIFAEGGAKFNEDHVSREAFGVPSTSHPHYLRAMQTKLGGGTYADCVNTFYESSIEPYRTLYFEGRLTKEKVETIAQKHLKLATNRAHRLFRGGGDTTSESGNLTNSKDTAYIEGLILSRKLSEANLEKYMFLTGINLDAVIFLLENNLISTDDIQGPTYKTLDIWERERSRFEVTT